MTSTAFGKFLFRLVFYGGFISSSLWLLWYFPWVWLAVHLACSTFLFRLCQQSEDAPTTEMATRKPAAIRPIPTPTFARRVS